MKNRRMLTWIVIATIVGGSAITFFGYRRYLAARQYTSDEGGFSLWLPRNCESPMIKHFDDGRSLWLWFCPGDVRIIVYKQTWEDFRQDATTEATKKHGVPPTGLVEKTAAGLIMGKYLAGGGPCGTLALERGNVGARDFKMSTGEFAMTRVMIDTRYSSYSAGPLEWQCGLESSTKTTVNAHLMVLFASSNLYQLVMEQSNTGFPDRWDEIIRSFHLR